MDRQQLFSSQDRIRWAIDRAKDNGLPPEALAAKVGISRPGMLHWTDEGCDIDSIGVGRMRRFAQAAGVNLEWIMSGRGQPTGTYTPSEEVSGLIDKLADLERGEPNEFKVVARLIRSAALDSTTASMHRNKPK